MASKGKKIEDKLKIVRAGTIAVALIVIIVIVAVALQMTNPPVEPHGNGNGEIPFEHYNETVNETIVGDTEINETEICDDDCLYGKAVSQADVRYCEWMKDETYQQECYKAIADENTDACLRVLEVGEFEKCIVANVNRTGDLSICENLNEEKIIECKALFEPCYIHKDATEQKECLALKYNDPAYCESDPKCLLNYSLEVSDKTICDSITKYAAERTACKSIHDIQDYCVGLQSVAEREYCWELYAVSTNQPLVCTQITSESQYAVECYSYFAAVNDDLGFCNAQNIQLNDRWNCYTEYTLTTGNTAGCAAINKLATTHIFNCYFKYGKEYGNAHACDMMNDIAFANTCYVGVVMNNTNLDWHYCGEVVNIEWRNKCYTQSAQLERDISLCDFIVQDLQREICTDSYHTFVNGQSD